MGLGIFDTMCTIQMTNDMYSREYLLFVTYDVGHTSRPVDMTGHTKQGLTDVTFPVRHSFLTASQFH